ncbi:putative AT DNA binding protein [Aspergillus puulaauensis]|uniref:AT DNA binding protein n=1 Tax=Aspergillus puulaauensis TaxID=1220207 RepID=A0A7R7XW50_9EURO|nr:uncharacterized protein APUU_70401S [Aspergillus puulaauensis]BCS28831.1 hypothetical protein APUU_70401S [Aspergillus puulaauensis]
MSNSQETPWTEDEKYALFTEILKKAGVSSRELFRMIQDMKIKPSWNDIPLPTGRSLNSCQTAFNYMFFELQPQANPAAGQLPPPRHHAPAPQVPHLDPSTSVRKRPLYPTDKPILPRAIQPRPVTGPASYSSESGASAMLSPGAGGVTASGEPPRKRGRPSKAESERRKAAAEARGETYPPSRSGSHKSKISSSPTSPSGIEASGSVYTSNRPPNIPQPGMGYVPPPLRMVPMSGPNDEGRMRSMSNREMGPTSRELPRPQEIRQTLPSPQELQLGHREAIPRIEPGDRPYESLPPDRFPFTDSSRRSLVHASPRHPDEPHAPDIQVPLTTTTEKRTE